MSRFLITAVVALVALTLCSCRRIAQAPAASTALAQQAPSPATKLEGFKPAAGTMVTMGYDHLGTFGSIAVDVRGLRDSKGAQAKGLVVTISESEYKEERAFIDADEVAELVKGIDALLEVKTNPTSFKNFEVRYRTRGSLELTAFSCSDNTIAYAVQAGSITQARKFIDSPGMESLRAMFVAGQAKMGPPTGN